MHTQQIKDAAEKIKAMPDKFTEEEIAHAERLLGADSPNPSTLSRKDFEIRKRILARFNYLQRGKAQRKARKVLHWTQTPAGRKRMSEVRKGLKAGKGSAANGKLQNGNEAPIEGHQILERSIAYAFGHCEAWLSIYARSSGVNEAELASGVAQLLHSASGRQDVGLVEHLPKVRRKAA